MKARSTFDESSQTQAAADQVVAAQRAICLSVKLCQRRPLGAVQMSKAKQMGKKKLILNFKPRVLIWKWRWSLARRGGTSLGSGSKARVWMSGSHKIRPWLGQAQTKNDRKLGKIFSRLRGRLEPRNAGKTCLNQFLARFCSAQSWLNASIAKARARPGSLIKAWAWLGLRKIRLVPPLLAGRWRNTCCCFSRSPSQPGKLKNFVAVFRLHKRLLGSWTYDLMASGILLRLNLGDRCLALCLSVS